MNIEELISEASSIIQNWQKTHSSTCHLFFSNNHVICKGKHESFHFDHPALSISIQQQIRGLTSPQWYSVGYALYHLQEKEILCQTHQKH